ncbi:PH domain-containing protein [Flammeovirga agarivorans]|uniref:PH domain-containing protein n=1 Tax=Flammeovirga agarivorans TaxID=2726742 RepID=A0A7X8SKK4_9BACT|nr:PH domain-containing protein [Flammeovirga agarivorans]NLR91965.1 PH domain-containing protein [Flammeovirga agarivorans]
MGLFNTLMGNVSNANIEDVQEKFGFVLSSDEQFVKAYQLVRDQWIFTNKRLLIVDKQGITGKKAELLTIPYKQIEQFSMETKGNFDADSELKIWVKRIPEPIETKFGSDQDVKEVYQLLSEGVL